MKTGKYKERFYREQMDAQGLTVFSVCDGETDLWIAAGKNLFPDALIRI
jgi:hypothetical protein